MTILNESTIEIAALEYLRELGFSTAFGPEIAPDGEQPERKSYDSVYLLGRMRDSITHLNPDAASDSVEEAIKRLGRAESQSPVAENMRLHALLRDGVPVERRDSSGQVRTDLIQLVDYEHPENNDWLAVNQFTVDEGRNRRPDIVLFLNGIPIALFELKNLADENATLRHAFNQIQTYRKDIPSIFTPNVIAVISDGTSAAMSSFSGQFEHYAPWKTVDGREVVTNRPALEVLIKGVFDQHRFLDLLQNFVVFSDEGNNGLIKRVAKYHQYWAVNAAVESTIAASGPQGDRRGGVVWHTQGSGKSFEMVFYAAKLMRDARMNNPTLVFITDRHPAWACRRTWCEAKVSRSQSATCLGR